jgi:hypothetical protein
MMNTLTMNQLALESLNPNPGLTEISGANSLSRLDTFYTTHAVWRAFQDGMKSFYQYAGRSTADSTLIAKANLRLLHHTLLDEPSYRERVLAAKHESPENGIPAIINLLTINGLSAELITLQSGCDARFTPCKLHNRMVMIVFGKVVISNNINSSANNNQLAQHRPILHESWWNQLRHASDKNVFKYEDIILLGQNDHEEKTLSALKHHCVLLNISLSAVQSTTSH